MLVNIHVSCSDLAITFFCVCVCIRYAQGGWGQLWVDHMPLKVQNKVSSLTHRGDLNPPPMWNILSRGIMYTVHNCVHKPSHHPSNTCYNYLRHWTSAKFVFTLHFMNVDFWCFVEIIHTCCCAPIGADTVVYLALLPLGTAEPNGEFLRDS